MTDSTDEEYVKLIQAMIAAAKSWLARQTGDVHLEFRAWDQPVTGPLDEANIHVYGLNEATREMLRAMDKATNHEATLMMAQIAVKCLSEEYGTPLPRHRV